MAAIELSVQAPEASVMLAKANGVAKLVEVTEITDAESYQAAGTLLQIITKSLKQLNDERERILKPIRESQQAVTALFKGAIEVRTNARDTLKRAMTDYADEVERQARERAAQQRALAEAEARRQREEAAAAQRKADEQAAKLRAEAEAARQAGDAKAAQRMEKRAEAAVERAEEKQQAAQVAEQAAAAPIAVRPAEAPKADGVHYRTTWKARVIDAALIPREYLMVDEAALAKLASAEKDKAAVPGVEFYAERTLITRTK